MDLWLTEQWLTNDVDSEGANALESWLTITV